MPINSGCCFPLSQLTPTPNLLYVSQELLILEILYKWNPAMFTLLCLSPPDPPLSNVIVYVSSPFPLGLIKISLCGYAIFYPC